MGRPRKRRREGDVGGEGGENENEMGFGLISPPELGGLLGANEEEEGVFGLVRGGAVDDVVGLGGMYGMELMNDNGDDNTGYVSHVVNTRLLRTILTNPF
jgi:hypothetical protein